MKVLGSTSFTSINKNVLKRILDTNWIGSNYSTRIWKNSELLEYNLNSILKTGLTAGLSYAKMSEQLQEAMNTSLFNSVRLIRTETNHFHNEAEYQSYLDDGVTEYEYSAVLDSRTSEICRKLDGKIFKVKEKRTGVNYPPMHPFCRSTTLPVIDSMVIEKEENNSTDELKSDRINANIIEEAKNLKYIDITNQYSTKKEYVLKKQKYFVDDNGIKYNVDGKHVILKPTEREIEVAKLLGNIIGGKVNIIPRVNEPSNIKTPDYIVNNEKFDLKQITGCGKYVIEGNLKKKMKQSNNFIIDLTKSEIKFEEVNRQIESIYVSKRYLWINKIFVIKENNIIKAYKRKK